MYNNNKTELLRFTGGIFIKSFFSKLSSSQLILAGFAAVILLGSLLLSLPFSTASGEAVSYTTALFTATTATCVTGLVVVPTVSWSIFGQAVILVLIQIGGLGVVAIMSGILIALNKRLGLGSRLILQDAFNLNSIAGIVRFTKRVLLGTLAVEGVGALLYMTVFVPKFGIRGIWISVFNSVSAFCNAGMDIIGEVSLCEYASHPLINLVTMGLIVLGGVGFIVWWDVIRVFRTKTRGKRKFWQNLTLHSKLVIVCTVVLIVLGAFLFFIFEYSNPATIGKMSAGEKILASLFQSVTTRTAGFATIPQENFTDISAILAMILMFIGASPVGTAGGIKTVTFAVMFLATRSMIRGKNDVTVFHRRISPASVSKCVAIFFISLSIAMTSSILLSLTTDRGLVDVLYEIFSATATVGLSRNLTPFLSTLGKYIVIFTMYFGRVGPISLAVAFNTKTKNENIIREPIEEISVG